MSFLIPKVRESFRNNELDKIFEDLFAGYDEFFSDTRYKDAEDNLVLEVECPGFNKNNLNVEIADGVLIVQGTREGKNKKELYKRFTVGKTEEVEAKVEDGILTLTFKLPKKQSTKLLIK